ncbi:hypothetical protein J6590_016845 [Homalodisca vitripennis]|nr:hypothetical protein J6590_016843 [Homalodisca vitripennis]KAG8278582.1 hypothetical protein J6590_016845 [Homalodisca vitripennis]
MDQRCGGALTIEGHLSQVIEQKLTFIPPAVSILHLSPFFIFRIVIFCSATWLSCLLLTLSLVLQIIGTFLKAIMFSYQLALTLDNQSPILHPQVKMTETKAASLCGLDLPIRCPVVTRLGWERVPQDQCYRHTSRDKRYTGVTRSKTYTVRYRSR